MTAELSVVIHSAVDITVEFNVFVEKLFKKILHNNYLLFVKSISVFVFLYFFVTSCILTEKHL